MSVVDSRIHPTLLPSEHMIHLVHEMLGVCEHPFKWNLEQYQQRPFTLNHDKFCHYSWENFLRPFLWRLTWAYESELKNNGPVHDITVRHLIVADNLMRREAASGGEMFMLIKDALSHIFFSTIAHMFALRQLYQQAYKILLKVKPISMMTPFERAGIFGAKAIILSAYGDQAKVDALSNIVEALKITPNVPDWRFVFVQLMCDLYDVNIGSRLVFEATWHMPYFPQGDIADAHFIFRNFANYIRNTWPQRNVIEAEINILLAVHELPDVRDNPERMQELHLQVVRALETDPFSKQVLISAIQFYKECDVHKALALSSIGKYVYIECGESWIDILHLLYPLEVFPIEHLLESYSESYSLDIRKRIALWYLDLNPSIAFSMALRILEIQNKEWSYEWFRKNITYDHSMEKPFSLWTEFVNTDFYRMIAFYASSLQNNPAGLIYLKHYEDVTNVKVSSNDISCQKSLNKLKHIFSKNILYKVNNYKFPKQPAPELALFLNNE